MSLRLSVRLYRTFGKRLLDILVSALFLLIFAPVFAALCVLIGLLLGQPVTFCQRRLGFEGRLFLIHKFRSMREANGPDGKPLPDAERLTAFGSLLRSTSLDEIPQFFDVLRGEMSLVGPRPLMPRYRYRYTNREWQRHSVRPGITGWAQVNGRNALDWESRLELDAQYVSGYNFWWDLKILFMTVAKVFKRSGISGGGEVSSPEFRPEGLQGNPMRNPRL